MHEALRIESAQRAPATVQAREARRAPAKLGLGLGLGLGEGRVRVRVRVRVGGFGARGVRVPGSRPQVLSMGERMETSLSVGARLKQVCPHGPGRWYGVALGRGKYGGAGCLRVRVCACMRLCVGGGGGGEAGHGGQTGFRG